METMVKMAPKARTVSLAINPSVRAAIASVVVVVVADVVATVDPMVSRSTARVSRTLTLPSRAMRPSRATRGQTSPLHQSPRVDLKM